MRFCGAQLGFGLWLPATVKFRDIGIHLPTVAANQQLLTQPGRSKISITLAVARTSGLINTTLAAVCVPCTLGKRSDFATVS